VGDIVLNWLAQSAVAALLLGAVIYLCRSLIEARLTRSVQHEFDKKLVTFQSDLEAEAKRQEVMRDAAFAGLLAQRNAFAAKRVEAAQGLWNGVLEARKGIGLALTLEILKVPELVKHLQDPKIQRYLKTVGSGEVMSQEYLARLNNQSAMHQPFVSPTAWALFAVYASIITFSIAKMQLLQMGEDPDQFLTVGHWIALIHAALLPDDFKKLGTSREYDLQWALKKLEDQIVDELRRSMAEESAGLESLATAQRILQAADQSNVATSTSLARAKAAEINELLSSGSN
jgi:hypothetical protein